MNHEFLHPRIIAAAKDHAVREYPKESCGLVVDGFYLPTPNMHKEPEKHFHIDTEVYLTALQSGKLQAILHSHPHGPMAPSNHDMMSQLTTGVPWGIIVTDGERAGDPVCWGDQLPIAKMIGRDFMHGVWDCYSIIRDAFRLGAEGLTAQGIDGWPHAPITLPEVARDDEWWKGDDDFYIDNFEPFGFKKIVKEDARPGDVFLAKIKSDKFNHGGVMVGNSLILHHLPTRLSRREPIGIWHRQLNFWIRYNA